MNNENGDRVLVHLKMDIPKILKFVLGCTRTSNYLSRVPKIIHHNKYDSGSDFLKHEFTYFF